MHAPNLLERDEHGLTALHRAAMQGDVDACLRVLLAGVDPNVPSGELNEDGLDVRDWSYSPARTPLILAIEHRRSAVVDLLIERHANVDGHDESRWSPLHEAVRMSDGETISKLASAGANLDEYCHRRSFDEELGWFFVGSPLHLASLRGDRRMASLLVDSGAAIASAWDDRRTPLIYAAARGATEVVEFLCECGADPNLREHRHEYSYFLDKSPLHYAARNGHIGTFEALVRCRAEPRAIESHSRLTAIEMLSERTKNPD